VKAGLTKGTKMFPGLPTQADVECSGMLASCCFRRLEACRTLADEALVEYIHQTGAAWPICKDPYGVPVSRLCSTCSRSRLAFSEENGKDLFGLFAEYQAVPLLQLEVQERARSA